MTLPFPLPVEVSISCGVLNYYLNSIRCEIAFDAEALVHLFTYSLTHLIKPIHCVAFVKNIRCVALMETIRCAALMKTIRHVALMKTFRHVALMKTIRCVALIKTIRCLGRMDSHCK